MIGILGLPWAAAAIYSGWSGKLWIAAFLLPVGVILYYAAKGTGVLVRDLQEGGGVIAVIFGQIVTLAIFYGIGFALGSALD